MALHGSIIKKQSANGFVESKDKLSAEFEYVFRRPPGTSAVDSVNGMTGDVVLTASDIEFKDSSFSALNVNTALKELMSKKAKVFVGNSNTVTPTQVQTKIQNGEHVSIKATITYMGMPLQCTFSSWADGSIVVASSQSFPMFGNIACVYLIGIINPLFGAVDTWIANMDILVSDAPDDNNLYGRKNSQWELIQPVENDIFVVNFYGDVDDELYHGKSYQQILFAIENEKKIYATYTMDSGSGPDKLISPGNLMYDHENGNIEFYFIVSSEVMGRITIAPDDVAIYDFSMIPNDSYLVHTYLNETISGNKTFSSPLTLQDKMILTSGVHYGTALPSAGTRGRIFFLKV